MYLAQSQNKKGVLIVEGNRRFFVSWSDLQDLKEEKYFRGNKPVIVLTAFKTKRFKSDIEDKISEVN